MNDAAMVLVQRELLLRAFRHAKGLNQALFALERMVHPPGEGNVSGTMTLTIRDESDRR